MKFEEVCPLKLKTVFEEISHKKIPKFKILDKETEILNTLGFTIINESAFRMYEIEIGTSISIFRLVDR